MIYSKNIGMRIRSILCIIKKRKNLYRLDECEKFFKWWYGWGFLPWTHTDNGRIFYHHVECRIYIFSAEKKTILFDNFINLGYISNWGNIILRSIFSKNIYKFSQYSLVSELVTIFLEIFCMIFIFYGAFVAVSLSSEWKKKRVLVFRYT